MAALSFAAVPLYRLFCQVTGYRGTAQKAEKPLRRGARPDREVHFDANVAADLPWNFEPLQSSIDVKVGENTAGLLQGHQHVPTSRPTGTAVFNVTPDAVGAHFNKVAVLLLHRAAARAGAVDRDGGRLLRRPDFRRATRDEAPSRADAVLFLLSGRRRRRSREGQAAAVGTGKGG